MSFSNVCVTYNPKLEPWVVPFDGDDVSDSSSADIDNREVTAWADGTLSREMKTTIHFSHYCSLFKANLLFKKYQAQYVYPESSRTTPLSTEDRRGFSAEAVDTATKLQLEIVSLINPIFQSCNANDEISPTRCGYSVSIFLRKVEVAIDVSTIELMLSMQYDSSKLGMMGIGFKKEPGDYAVITGSQDGLGLPSILESARIVAVDDASVVPLTHGELRNLLRGPVGSSAKLLIIPAGLSQPVEVEVERGQIHPMFADLSFKK